MAAREALVVHRNISLMLCENPAVLEEILVELDLDELIHQRLGARAIVAPTQELVRLRDALHARGVYPRIVGEVLEQGEGDFADDEDGADLVAEEE